MIEPNRCRSKASFFGATICLAIGSPWSSRVEGRLWRSRFRRAWSGVRTSAHVRFRDSSRARMDHLGMIKRLKTGFPVLLLAGWMTLAVLTITSFIAFISVWHH